MLCKRRSLSLSSLPPEPSKYNTPGICQSFIKQLPLYNHFISSAASASHPLHTSCIPIYIYAFQSHVCPHHLPSRSPPKLPQPRQTHIVTTRSQRQTPHHQHHYRRLKHFLQPHHQHQHQHTSHPQILLQHVYRRPQPHLVSSPGRAQQTAPLRQQHSAEN